MAMFVPTTESVLFPNPYSAEARAYREHERKVAARLAHLREVAPEYAAHLDEQDARDRTEVARVYRAA